MSDLADDFLQGADPVPTVKVPQRGDVSAVITERRFAYQRVFAGKGSVRDVEIVMLDLGHFCRAFASTYHPVHSDRLDGRREVFLRIMDFTQLPHDALYLKYHQGTDK